jgi:GNAT superfamily N-acetyltransferase
MTIVVDLELKPDDQAIIRERLYAYNDAQVDGTEARIGVLLKDDAGQTVGGLTAHCYYGWMFIELLFVPDAMRGEDLGTQLMNEAERIARERGVRGIWLDSFSFQAPRFYEKLGYTTFGELPDYPVGHSRYFLSKRLDGAQPI